MYHPPELDSAQDRQGLHVLVSEGITDRRLLPLTTRPSLYYPHLRGSLSQDKELSSPKCIPAKWFDLKVAFDQLERAADEIPLLFEEFSITTKRFFWTFSDSESLQNSSLSESFREMLQPILVCAEFLYSASNAKNLQISCNLLADCDTWELQFATQGALAASWGFEPETFDETIASIYLVNDSDAGGESVSEKFEKASNKLLRVQAESEENTMGFCAITNFHRTLCFDFTRTGGRYGDQGPAVRQCGVDETPSMLLSLLYAAFYRKSLLIDTEPPRPFPLELPSGCDRDPDSEQPISLEPLRSFSDGSLYDMRELPAYWERFERWHLERIRLGRQWLADTTDKCIHFLRPAFATETAPDMSLPNYTTTGDRSTRIQQRILSRACSYPQRGRIREKVRRQLEKTNQVKIIRPLQIGVGCWAQVFEVELSPSHQVEPIRAVIKIFDERMFNIPKWELGFRSGINLDQVLNGWIEGEMLARKEAWAYQKLGLLQGGVVPEFYGCWEVRLPDGHSCHAHLLEFVAGRTFGPRLAQRIPLSYMKEIADAIAFASVAINILGVQHGDPEQFQNIRLTETDSDPPVVYPVILDFAKSRPFELDLSFDDVGLCEWTYLEINKFMLTVRKVSGFCIDYYWLGEQERLVDQPSEQNISL